MQSNIWEESIPVSTCKVSVIIATYNTAAYLEECLDSIFGQTLKDIEVILIDDGSTDNTAAIIDRYQHKYNNLVSCYQENQGAGIARNYGITLSQGEYMIFMDPDDKYPCEDCLERLYEAVIKNHVQISGGNMLWNDNGVIRNKYSAGEGDTECIKNGVINTDNYFFIYGHTRYLFKTDLIKNNQIKYASYSNYEDQVFTMNALGKAGCFYELDYPVYEHRINHKQRKMDLGVLFDTLCGFRDTLKIIIKYNMQLMFEKNFDKFMGAYIFGAANYVFCGNVEFDRVIYDINNLARETKWNYDTKFILTPEKIEECRKDIRDAKERLSRLFLKDSPIIIYGAGKNTRRLISAYRDEMQNVVGIAVSDLEDNCLECEGIPVRHIEDYVLYKENAMVLITPAARMKKEIIDLLESKGFMNYEWIDARMIEQYKN